MPYTWERPANLHEKEPELLARLNLWPHRSLSRRGFAAFILATYAFLMLPLLAVLGSAVMWGLLPFSLGALGLLWFFLDRSFKDGTLTEELSLWPNRVELIRHNPRNPDQSWAANPYWVRIELHRKGGPIENYLTMEGDGRTVEIGSFLSPEERQSLYHELLEAFQNTRTRQ
ncbi:MAG: DUF2244 domain-containing protein [Paracoccaceae bacterium]|nr:DUF2244 domain-containing protein [Paracoccaceae bacterium]